MSRGTDSREGATSIEYGLIAAIIAIVIICAVTVFGPMVMNVIHRIF